MNAQAVIQEKDEMMNRPRFWGRRTLAVFCVLGLLIPAACKAPDKQMVYLEGQRAVFREPGFWSLADSLFGDYGGGFWLWSKETDVKRGPIWGWKTVSTYHWRLVVLDANGMEEYADVVIPLRPSSELTRLDASTIMADGTVLAVDEKNVFERPRIPDYMLYSDQRDMVFAMPGFSDSCVLDVRYVVEEDSPILTASFHLGRELPVRSASYSYRLDHDIKNRGAGVMVRGYNSPRDPQVKNEYSDRLFYVYYLNLSDLPAYPDEAWMPPRESVVPRVLVGAYFGDKKKPDWNGFAKFYRSVLPNLDDPSPAIEELSARLAGGVGDDAGMIRRVSEYVGKNIRYVAIDLNESGFRPNEPDAVLENRYGDCKDMSMLAIALLRQAGVSAYPALLVTRSAGEIDKDLLAPYFNHMIVYVETSRGGKIWLDPTAGVCPLGYLPHDDMGVDALIIKEGRGVWQKTPGYTIYPPARRSYTSVAVLPDGGVAGIIRHTYEGHFALSRSHLLDATARRELGEVITELLNGYIPDAEFDEGRKLKTSRDSLTVTIAANFSRPHRSFNSDGEQSLSLDFPEPMVYYLAEIHASSERRAPLWFPYEWSEVDTVCIRKPESCTSCAPPTEFELKSAYGSGTLQCTESDSQLVVVRTYALRADSVGTDDIGDFVEFWEDVRARSRGRVTFEVASD